MNSENLILALDGMNKSEALSMVSILPELKWVKVGLELFVHSGPEIISELKETGVKVFLDLKFHDIPETMARACYQASITGADLISIHACSGKYAMQKAVEASIDGSNNAGLSIPKILAVTVLTSWNDRALGSDLLINQAINKRVEHFAQLSNEAGVGGCICSPLEVEQLRNIFPVPFELVTPGIRNKDDTLSDQVRTMTASQAINSGASKIVVGRPITKALDPISSFNSFCN